MQLRLGLLKIAQFLAQGLDLGSPQPQLGLQLESPLQLRPLLGFDQLQPFTYLAQLLHGRFQLSLEGLGLLQVQ